ncbi:MAG: hypothetical protein GKR88_02315 [Flavobacteriaceae bacterium]|nr:MAG: hypothetical protein GKR88_02315 [Flavobacteriaceae bacterium]
MKKISLFIVSILFIVSCTNESEIEKVENPISKKLDIQKVEFPDTSKNSAVDGLKLPEGSIVKKINKSTIKIILPKGYVLVEVNNNRFVYYSETSYTCTCSGSNGCDVFYVRGNYGCSHGSCTGQCTGQFTNNANRNINKENLFIIKKDIHLSPSTDKEFENLDYMPEKLVLNLRSEFQKYAKSIYGDRYSKAINYVDNANAKKSDINNIMLVKMKMYGYKFIYAVSTNDLKPEMMQSNRFIPLTHEGGHSCNCESGNSGCTADSSWGVKYCKGGSCTKCTMTVD